MCNIDVYYCMPEHPTVNVQLLCSVRSRANRASRTKRTKEAPVMPRTAQSTRIALQASNADGFDCAEGVL